MVNAEKRCVDCNFWRSKCAFEKVVLHIASSPACGRFAPKDGKFQPICDLLRYTK